MKCATCGAENDAANRFCDQCGALLTAGAATPAPSPTATSGPSTCPTCGAVVVPGEAFCDTCGAALTPPSPVDTAAVEAALVAPIAAVAPFDDAAPSQNTAVNGPICPVCGHQNMPGDQFCDACGAALNATPVTQIQPPSETPPAAPPSELPTPDAIADQTILAPSVDAPAPEASAIAPSADAPTPEASAVAPSTDAPTMVDPTASYTTSKQAHEAEIARQGQIIAQFEQMQAMFGNAAPPAVAAGLGEARAAQTAAQSALDALIPPAPAVDPAEVARHEAEIARQGQIIVQFEQMRAMFGDAAPPAVAAGLAEARAAQTAAQDALDALHGGAAPSAAAQAPADVAAAAQAPADVAADGPATVMSPPPAMDSGNAPTVLAPPPVIAPPPPLAPLAPPAPKPRLVIEASGREIPLMLDRRELTIGREDPISGIHPEIDLTTHGGETGGVSRQHARIIHDGASWTIVDLNSTNYTRVNGEQLKANTPVPIADGARIQFGKLVTMLKLS